MLGKRLKEARLRSGMTQGDVAKAVGISQAAYCRVEKGNKVLSFGVMTELAKILNVSLDYLGDVTVGK